MNQPDTDPLEAIDRIAKDLVELSGEPFAWKAGQQIRLLVSTARLAGTNTEIDVALDVALQELGDQVRRETDV